MKNKALRAKWNDPSFLKPMKPFFRNREWIYFALSVSPKNDELISNS